MAQVAQTRLENQRKVVGMRSARRFKWQKQLFALARHLLLIIVSIKLDKFFANSGVALPASLPAKLTVPMIETPL